MDGLTWMTGEISTFFSIENVHAVSHFCRLLCIQEKACKIVQEAWAHAGGKEPRKKQSAKMLCCAILSKTSLPRFFENTSFVTI
jgi:hypothetical protein